LSAGSIAGSCKIQFADASHVDVATRWYEKLLAGYNNNNFRPLFLHKNLHS